MKLQIMTRLGATCFTFHLRGNDTSDFESEIKKTVKWFINSVPPDIKGYTDTRIVIERDGKQVFQFTIDSSDKRFMEEEMQRFERSFSEALEGSVANE